ncbi:MAG: hypothetical protein FRX48_00379 [Lasallia pustulata]|uniref:Uncharacterized protein n=1 Tax=Lasallia pustulata TaxID=136370 RepID=A0A5M8Q1T7_9LECA|nr:MAG: hypothetical protein FRX48_00379 [Lasallia pustulata]
MVHNTVSPLGRKAEGAPCYSLEDEHFYSTIPEVESSQTLFVLILKEASRAGFSTFRRFPASRSIRLTGWQELKLPANWT